MTQIPILTVKNAHFIHSLSCFKWLTLIGDCKLFYEQILLFQILNKNPFIVKIAHTRHSYPQVLNLTFLNNNDNSLYTTNVPTIVDRYSFEFL